VIRPRCDKPIDAVAGVVDDGEGFIVDLFGRERK
jgi:hypothetical protein